MKILHIVQRYSPAFGGSEKYMKNISEYMSLKNNVEVWTTDALDIESFWDIKRERIEKKEERINGVLVRRFSVAPSILSNFIVNKLVRVFFWRLPFSITKNLTSFPYVFGMLRYALSRKVWDFDVIHVTSSPYNILFYIALIIKRRSNAKLIISPFVHLGEGKDDPIRKYYFKPESAIFYKHADIVLVQTNQEKKALVAFCKKYLGSIDKNKFIKLGIGIDVNDLKGGKGERFRKKYSIGIKERILFYIGAKRSDKGVINLIKASTILWKSGKRFKLVLAGNPSVEFNQYLERVKEKFSKNIINIDNISDKEKLDLYSAGDVFCMVSRSDSFGIVYLESWIYKKPVIGCQTPVISEIINNQSDGLLSQFNDVKGISKNIWKLLNNEKLRIEYGQNGYEKVLNNYILKDKLKAMSDLYTHRA